LHQTEIGGGDPARVISAVLAGRYRAVLVRYLDDAESLRVAFAGAEQRLVVGCVAARSAAEAIAHAAAAVGHERLRARLALATGQRLLRRLCPVCRAAAPLTAQEAAQLAALGARDVPGVAQRGKGCDRCGHTGYAGQLLVCEVIAGGDTVTRALAANDDNGWRAAYREEGNRDLLTAALAEVQRGRTSATEALAMEHKTRRSAAR
jgi:type II secretory ATPase GspE/PulE/Tfp pilus assembly ATPase PilB-like protein